MSRYLTYLDVKISAQFVRHMDHVDWVLAQWRKERPDLNAAPMAISGRIRRLGTFFVRKMEQTWGEFGLNQASFDVLATLRRSGPPFALSPTELIESTMVTSGTMTHRIDQLEDAGLVVRVQSDQDGRSYRIRLTPRGRALIDKALEKHVETLRQLTHALSKKEEHTLNELLRKMLLSFEAEARTTRRRK
jgi:DNA-binding MarR family transcriptional regulator